VGKVAVGQRARLYLAAYPDHEFGVVEGKVASIAEVAVNGEYYITLQLPANAGDQYGKRLPLPRTCADR